MRSRIILVGAFVLVHVWLAIINLYLSPGGMTDVYGVYFRWMQDGFTQGIWAGIDTPWVYPVVALVPMALAYLPGAGFFPESWLVLVTLLDLAALLVVIRRTPAAGWAWTAFLLALGPIAIGRIDTITVPLVIIALVVLSRHPIVAGVLLAVATWIKVWPAVVIAAVLVAARQRWRVLLAVVSASAVIVLVGLALGAGDHLASFVSSQTARGLQIEAPVTTPWMWAAFAGDGEVYFDHDIITWQVTGDGVDLASQLMNPLLAIGVVAALVLGLIAQRRGAHPTRVLILLALALVASLIVFNKVGSPQYYTWFAAPVVLMYVSGDARSYRMPVVMIGAIAVLTQFIYPYLYFLVVDLNPVLLAMLTVRNLLVVGVLVWAVAALVQGARQGRRRALGVQTYDESFGRP